MDELKYVYDIQKELSYLSGVYALLDWDEKTHMPSKGIEERAEQTALIYRLMYERMTSKKLVGALKKLKGRRLSKKDELVVNELGKQVTKLIRVPKDLMVEIARTSVIASSKWQEARKKDDFTIFKPHLKRLVKLKIKQAKLINPKLTPYDALLDDYEEGMTSEKLTTLFDYLKKELVQLVEEIKHTKQFKKQKELNGDVLKERQERLVKNIIKLTGINNDTVALDISAHPFTLRISQKDVRITTRYPNVFDAFFSAVHESGHALYELGLPKEYNNTLIHESASLGLHESQSRFWENQIMRSKQFWQGYAKHFSKLTGIKIRWSELYKKANIVKPSFIRTEADEVTYCLHVILRFEIERDLINGKLKVDDAKEVWNKKMQEYLGIVPKKDNDGILQDVHWSFSFGYFPTYAIGTIYSSQIRREIEKEIKNFPELVRKHQFAPILNWLRKNIHEKGKTMTADEIIRNACGKGLNPETYITYLREKYEEIYGV